MTLLSFIIPVYKTPLGLLRNCLDAVLKYSQPMELICVLDSPGDPCEQVLDEYAAKNPRMRLLKNDQNRGVSYSRNRGLDAATGEYVAFVDADDEIVAEGYLRAAELVSAQKVAGCVLTNQRNAGKVLLGVKPGESLIGSIREEMTAGRLVSAFDLAVYPMVLRKRLFANYGISFREGHRFGEDYMVVTQLLCTGELFAFLNEVGYKSVGHEGSTCHSAPCPERYEHGLTTVLTVMRCLVRANAARSARRRHLACNIPLTLTDWRAYKCISGVARDRYYGLLDEFSHLILNEYQKDSSMPVVFLFWLVAHWKQLWFLPGMPLAFILKVLAHFHLLLCKA